MKKEKLINLQYAIEKEKYVGGGVTRISVNDKNVMIDLRDSSEIDMNSYSKSDFYFKRMLLNKDYGVYDKLHPYGLNYSVMTESKGLKYLFLKDKKYIKYSLKYFKILTKLLKVNDSLVNCNYKNFERKPIFYLPHMILFSARLWNPANNDTQWKKEERKVLNDQRISIIRFLKEKYKTIFNGGIQDDDFAKSECSDLIVNSHFSSKKEYLRLLKKTTICVANQGLEDSIGWKFAEYICNSSAILSTPVDKYKTLGPLKEGVNYLTYTNKEDFDSKLQTLLNDKEIYRDMSINNFKYYQEYLHPLSKMKKIIKTITNV
jgi:glycosyltransferase involved in cell wall biosynthesis